MNAAGFELTPASEYREEGANRQVCAKDYVPRKEPLIVTLSTEYPWQMNGTDLFEIAGEHHLLVVDYFSRYPEIARLSSKTSAAV